MQTTAIQINVKGKPKIVGKIIVMPQNTIIPKAAGYIALYREVLWKDLVSYKLNCVGIDEGAWNYCNEQKCEGMVCYSKDAMKLVTVSAKDINSCKKIDMGEHPQIRIPLSMCKIYENVFKGIPTTWTNNIITIEPKKDWEKQETAEFEFPSLP